MLWGPTSRNGHGQGIGAGSRRPLVKMRANPLEAGLWGRGEQGVPGRSQGGRPLTQCHRIANRFGQTSASQRRSAPPTHPVLTAVLSATLTFGSNCSPALHTHSEEMSGYKTLKNTGSPQSSLFSPKDSHRSRKRLQTILWASWKCCLWWVDISRPR